MPFNGVRYGKEPARHKDCIYHLSCSTAPHRLQEAQPAFQVFLCSFWITSRQIVHTLYWMVLANTWLGGRPRCSAMGSMMAWKPPDTRNTALSCRCSSFTSSGIPAQQTAKLKIQCLGCSG